ncbi:hypothetical protein [Streptomyces sp. NPDC047803]|uniref:hypothetical protein n=1 Tax=unclassified Streptomyces TaxID=2593676 RepID=UPI0033D28F79
MTSSYGTTLRAGIMSHADDSLRALVVRGVQFSELIAHLSRERSGTLTPLEFMRVFQEELGISFIESRKMLEYFDPQMNPIIDIKEVDKRGNVFLCQHFPARS